MRLFVLAALAISGCTVESRALRRPYVEARIESSKAAPEFARCVASAMGVQPESNGLTVIRKDHRGYLAARWDFVATNGGSQAELRNGGDDDGGLQTVRGCA